ncbi:MBL fold metallo-hydrolase [Paracoccus liaowanqingii]|uniref:MBL fold metallo-hydrolase n=1 Tax=Paracoccus liaowanqingii TaxID=2560053 RepID=A0A4P7HND9_9RHOB|nr:MBL fold metallo-hydrolase [Paracoccus liaowanqingii]QBX35260.1 MBL fold metallo-hydrolase [Paracoccus liaowanqingii]
MCDPAKEPLQILAPNPSALTGPGTTTFLIGQDHVAVIDPGPDDADHLDAVARAGRDRIGHILVTHAHRDHSAGAARLSRLTGAPVLAYGDAQAGRAPLMARLAAGGLVAGGEGLDHDFAPDRLLADGEVIATPDWQLTALHTPGHAAGHLSFQWGAQIFCGDLVMGWSSTLISPPDGDLGDYLRSLDRLVALAPRRLRPTHGAAIEAPLLRLAELAHHRRARTTQILAALRQSSDSAQGLARRIYAVPDPLLPAAARNVLAHLIALAQLGAVDFPEEISERTIFSAA